MVRLSVYLVATAALFVGANALVIENSDSLSASLPQEESYQENAVADDPSKKLKDVLDALKKLPPLPKIKDDPAFNNVDLDKLKDVISQIADLIKNGIPPKPANSNRHEFDNPFDDESDSSSEIPVSQPHSESVKAVLKARDMYVEEVASASADAPAAEVSSPPQEINVEEDDTLTQAGFFDGFGKAPGNINLADLNKQLASVSKAFSIEVIKHSKEIEEIASLIGDLAKAQKAEQAKTQNEPAKGQKGETTTQKAGKP